MLLVLWKSFNFTAKLKKKKKLISKAFYPTTPNTKIFVDEKIMRGKQRKDADQPQDKPNVSGQVSKTSRGQNIVKDSKVI